MRLKKRIYFGTVLFLLLICIAAYKIQPYKSGAEYRSGLKDYSEQDGTAQVNLTINDFPITINTFAPDSEYETAWLTTETETAITVGPFAACRIWINGIEVMPEQSISLNVESISNTGRIPIRILDDRSDYDRTVYLRTLPAALSAISVESYGKETASLSPLLCSVGNYIVKFDSSGSVLYYRFVGNAVDFQSVVTKSGKRYTYLESVASEATEEYGSYKAVVMDEHFKVIDIVENITVNGESFPLCKNGFHMLNDGDYVLAAAVPTVRYPEPNSVSGELTGDRVIQYHLERRQNGGTIWSWDSSEVKNVPKSNDPAYNGVYRDDLIFSDLVYDEMERRIMVAFEHAERPVILNIENGIEIAAEDDMIGTEIPYRSFDMDLSAAIETPFPVAWAQLDTTGQYLLVSYAEHDGIAGSVYDMRSRRLLEDIVFPAGLKDAYWDKFVFDDVGSE